MLEPAEPNRGWMVVAVGIVAVAAMLGAGRLEGRWRHIAAVGAIVPLTALMLLAGRVADELLLPGGWSELAGGISRGISDLPGVRVPYRGLDDWVRTVIPLGGSALVVIAALLAFWPRRSTLGFQVPALIVLIVLYVVPVVALEFNVEFLRGAVFTLLMVAFLRLEKLRRPDSLAAAALAVLATLVALGAAPILNRDTPWFDYETWAADTSASKSTSFSWDVQTYGGLNWPRDGRELIRVKAKRPAYWKTTNLDAFDGRIWRRSSTPASVAELPTNNPQALKDWTQTIKVSFRNLRSDQFVTAGYASAVDIPRLDTTPTLDGLYLPGRTLRRGDAYTAKVYTPIPTERQRRRAGVDYESALTNYTTIHTSLQDAVPGASEYDIAFPFFGTDGGTVVYPPRNGTAEEVLQRAKLNRIYALSQNLAEGAKTPDDYVQRVLAYFAKPEFTYSEVPPKASSTLDGFLFDTKQGYCQQYSGAMALLLRMAGIPARVVSGFSTGATDFKTGEYVVRDFDAHAWVEVYYPKWGWLTFDPTPADSPARSQPADARTTSSNLGSGSSTNFGGDPLSERGASTPVAGDPPRGGTSRRSSPARSPSSASAIWRCAAGVAARLRRCRSSSARSSARAANRPPEPRCTRSSCASRTPPTPRVTSGRCVRAATATRRAIRRAHSAAACGPSSDAAVVFWATSGPGGPSRLGNSRFTIVVMDDVYDLYQRGMALLEDGHYHQAIIPLAKARELEPDKTSIREALGRAYFRTGRFEEARVEFEAVVECAPTNDYALFCLGRALMQLGRTAEARKPLTLAANMNPSRRDYRIYRDRARKAA